MVKRMININVKVIVATHDFFEMPKQANYLPVFVGAYRKDKIRDGYQPDDEGINISEKNPTYCELTAIYWGWKNLKNIDAIGLVHYRRYFFNKKPINLKNVLSEYDIEKLLKRHDIIVPRKRNYYIETNYSHYIHAHNEEPLRVLKNIIKESYPEYSLSFDKVMKRHGAHMFNMFIMKKKFFDNYADFVFGLLSLVERKVDISNYSVQEQRVFGYLSELLMDVWIEKNNVNYVEVPWNQIGKKHILKKATNFLIRKFSKTKGHQTHY